MNWTSAKSWTAVGLALATPMLADSGAEVAFDEISWDLSGEIAQNDNVPNGRKNKPKPKPIISLSPRRPIVKALPDVFVEGSLLYWQGSESGLTYVQDLSLIPNATSDYIKCYSPHFKWDWGFKIGAGYNMPYDGWDLYADWTRFHPGKSRRQLNIASDDTTTSFIISRITTPYDTASQPGSSANAEWGMKLDFLDLELGRESYLGKHLFFRLFAGLRSLWLDQRYIVEYNDFQEVIGGVGVDVDISSNSTCNYWGLGPRAGLNTQWNLGADISFFANLGLSALLGRFHTLTIEDISSLTIPKFYTTNNFQNAMRFVGDFDLGLRWQRVFIQKYALLLQLGWEQHLFVNQNQFFRAFNSPSATFERPHGDLIIAVNQGDLSTQGVTFTARFDF